MTPARGYTPACPLDAIPENGTHLVRLGERRQAILLCRSGAGVFAIEPWCSHAAQELSCGLVHEGWIACPAHGARFDLASGEALTPPASRPLPTYPLQVRDGMVLVDLGAG